MSGWEGLCKDTKYPLRLESAYLVSAIEAGVGKLLKGLRPVRPEWCLFWRGAPMTPTLYTYLPIVLVVIAALFIARKRANRRIGPVNRFSARDSD